MSDKTISDLSYKHIGLIIDVCSTYFTQCGGLLSKDDLINESFLAIRKAVVNFTPYKGRWTDYAARCVHTACWRLFRKSKIRICRFDVIEAQIDDRFNSVDIYDMIESLPIDERHIVTDYFYRGLSCEVMARRVGQTGDNYRLKLNKALARMKKILEE